MLGDGISVWCLMLGDGSNIASEIAIDYRLNGIQWETVLYETFLGVFPITGWGLIHSLKMGSTIVDDDQD